MARSDNEGPFRASSDFPSSSTGTAHDESEEPSDDERADAADDADEDTGRGGLGTFGTAFEGMGFSAAESSGQGILVSKSEMRSIVRLRSDFDRVKRENRTLKKLIEGLERRFKKVVIELVKAQKAAASAQSSAARGGGARGNIGISNAGSIARRY